MAPGATRPLKLAAEFSTEHCFGKKHKVELSLASYDNSKNTLLFSIQFRTKVCHETGADLIVFQSCQVQ